MKTKKLLYVVFAAILLSICILLSLYGTETGKYIECPQCGKKNFDTNIFCRFCGMRLSKQVEEAREDSTVTDIVDTLYQEGVNFIMSGNYYAALGIFEKIIEEFPDSPYAAYANPLGPGVVINPGMGFRLISVLTMTAGTIFIMWLGEQITEKGIGNGISLIIMVGIIARYPNDALNAWRLFQTGVHGFFFYIVLVVFVVLITAAVIFITQGQRRIPVQYARRVVGRKIYGGQSTFIPLNVNAAGVIPIIFAQSVIMLPTTLAQFLPKSIWMDNITAIIQPGYWLYNVVYGILIVVFAYFYTAIIINPADLADNMKKYGGFIPGKRPGAKTSEYIDRIITRITLPGALFFALVAIIPMYLIVHFKVPFYFGGTSLLITVGVLLDTVQQIEAQLMMRHYDGFLKKGKIRGRRR